MAAPPTPEEAQGRVKETRLVDFGALRVPSAGLRRTPSDSDHQLQRRPAEATGGAGDFWTDTAHHGEVLLLSSISESA
ncbi:uncharacterized protein TrAtP1_011156 [Trichoderma atroviride]|uniref:uncharacterized protein n=1 Tax=Hypocrea atroviridis TaxID=63577 RepID=UPI00331B965E|nr:hypothetical protein TrAtP1_011156 [Trichoderma atroviride]